MATSIKPDGSFEVIYGSKYTGINVQMPANLIADSDAVDINNFIVRNAQITSRPAFGPWLSSPVTSTALSEYAGSGVDNGGPQTWTNPSNITGAPDTNYAVATATTLVETNPLAVTSYGFAVPPSTIIMGVTVNVSAHATSTPSIGDAFLIAALTYNGSIIGIAQDAAYVIGAGDSAPSMGGASFTWGTTLTPTIVNDPTFGVVLMGQGRNSNVVWSLDSAQITVTYSAPLTGVGTFLSPTGHYHTFAMDTLGRLYNLNPATNTLAVVATLSTLQSPNPVSWRVFNNILYWVNGSQSMGAWDGQVAAGGIITYGVAAGGSGYAPGDTGHVTTGGANAVYKVLTVNGSGAILSFTITNSGSSYTASPTATNATSVTTGSGNGALTIYIFTIGIGPSEQVAKVTINSTGDTPIGARYIDILDQQVILLNTVGTASDGPFTVRWSATGLPTQFDPTVNLNAGFNIFIDFADAISGFMGLGRVGYIFHRTGITEMAPTGVGTAPFDFNHIWNSQDGIGNIFPNTIAQYGSTGVFVSSENIYSVSNYQFQSIGGGARDAIFEDFNSALIGAGNPLPIGTIVPGYEDDFVYLVYQLFIPLGPTGPTIMWQYSFENVTWERLTITGELVTGTPTFCLTA